jgi:predicted RNA-binding Zn-ribbon protein involved in translation (DUF1610 family)
VKKMKKESSLQRFCPRCGASNLVKEPTLEGESFMCLTCGWRGTETKGPDVYFKKPKNAEG